MDCNNPFDNRIPSGIAKSIATMYWNRLEKRFAIEIDLL
jgi:hypothetical protein